ncbi:TPA: pathogenicity island 1 effector protein StpP [Salmonella enterica]|nr:pathogenicity island 1 effector protein StpP [Salmonella enterica]HCL5342459.1 pathogenicity island 1 effector protein StpP [Salmonella enterica]
MNILTLSAIAKPDVLFDSWLHRAKECPHDTHVASEKFSSKVLTWLGKVPLFKNIDAVRKHAENTQVPDTEAFQQFLRALTEKHGEKAVGSVLLMSRIDINKPLTERVITQIRMSVEAADKGLNASLVKKNGDTKVVEQRNAFDTNMFKKQLLDIALKGLNDVIPGLENIDGNRLRENFTEMASGNGSLRRLMTNLHSLNEIPEAQQLNEYAMTLKNIQVGVAPFSQWGTDGGVVARWIDKASNQELNQAATKIQAITKELKIIATQLGNIKAGAPMPQMQSGPTLGLARFPVSNVPVNQYTQVKLNDGTPMAVNTLSSGGKAIALAGSYPKNTSDALEAHMKMLFEKECSCLVVLTAEEQMQARNLPDYFRGRHIFGEVHTNSQKVNSGNQGENVDQYKMQLSWGEKRYTIPVLHVKNWPDHQPLPSVAYLENLADSVKSMINKSGASGHSSSDKHLPMIHCLGGVGRTGTMAAALVLKDNPGSNLEQVRADFRESRNNRMLEDASQFEQLKAMQAQLLTKREC